MTSHCVVVAVAEVDLVTPFARAMRFVVEHLPNPFEFRNYQFFPHLLLNDSRGKQVFVRPKTSQPPTVVIWQMQPGRNLLCVCN